MKESLARIHVHELEVPETKMPIPEAANDNVELPASRFAAANDNEIQLVVAGSPEENAETAHVLSETRSRLGLAVEVPATKEGTEEESATPEELPQLKPEDLQEMIESTSPEKVAAQSNSESADTNIEASAAQSAGGASDDEGGGDGSKPPSGGNGGGSAFTEAGKERGKAFGTIGKILKYALLAPLWVISALIAGGLKMVSSITNKILTSAKLTKGEGSGGGGSKSSGGGGGSKPSGGSGGHH